MQTIEEKAAYRRGLSFAIHALAANREIFADVYKEGNSELSMLVKIVDDFVAGIQGYLSAEAERSA